jgi:hypothetical protein
MSKLRFTQKQLKSGSSEEPIKQSPARAEDPRPDVAAAASHSTTGSSLEPSLAPDVAATADPKLAYSINETARILSISRGTVYKAVNHQLLTKIELLGKPLITRASIDNLLAGKKRQ